MVRGLFSSLKFPYAQFPCTSVCGDQFYDIFWEAICRLERCGFKVLACTCDGLSANRRFMKLHNAGSLVEKVLNPYSSDGRYLFFLSDPPHLIKTVRNCWASQKRLLWVSICSLRSIRNYTYNHYCSHSMMANTFSGHIFMISTRETVQMLHLLVWLCYPS